MLVWATDLASSLSHIGVSAERKFFDSIKEVLSASGSKDSWIELVKCLELFGNDLISRKELFSLVRDLLDPAGESFFDEFRALMSSRLENESSGHDLWYSIPLSEIDFTQCRKCSPSYRALPRDYPRPVCSERSVEEQSVLNDDWVSIPIGSEDSPSFKHMRKNQFEEALFKCEDDRFEVDALIDSNAGTIRILEPIAEEISSIFQLENLENQVPRFNFQLEKRNENII